jgi:DNA-directed RNA polymerase subunit RPC12/RpoP
MQNYFVQSCPTCGRSLRIQIKYLGRQVSCRHCNGQFRAEHDEDAGCSSGVMDTPIMKRVESALQRASENS